MKGILILTGIAFFISIIIVILDILLKKNDNLIDEIEKRLPNYNCGGCGFGSCKGMATCILKDPDAYKKCRPLRDKTELLKFLDENKIKYNKE